MPRLGLQIRSRGFLGYDMAAMAAAREGEGFVDGPTTCRAKYSPTLSESDISHVIQFPSIMINPPTNHVKEVLFLKIKK